MQRSSTFLLALLLGGCHWVFGHAPGTSDGALLAGDRARGERSSHDTARVLDGGPSVPACASCEFNPGAGAICQGQRIAPTVSSANQVVLRVELATVNSPCSELEIELELEDPLPTPAKDSWLLDVGDSPSNNGFGGDIGSGDLSFANDSELELVRGASSPSWTLNLWGNDYYKEDRGTNGLVGSIGNFVPATGKSKVRLRIGHQRVEATSEAAVKLEQSFAPVSSGDPTAPCAFFCLYQKDKYSCTLPAGDGLLYVALQRTILPRPGSESSGITRARIDVR